MNAATTVCETDYTRTCEEMVVHPENSWRKLRPPHNDPVHVLYSRKVRRPRVPVLWTVGRRRFGEIRNGQVPSEQEDGRCKSFRIL
jgi:hypothetical protein